MLKKLKLKTMEEKENTFQPDPSVSANMIESDDNAVDHSKIARSGGEEESYFCKMCEISVRSSDSLDIHLQSLHFIRKSANRFLCGCDPCAETFHTSELLMNHLRREHTVQTFNACGGCGKKLPRSYSVPTHCSSKPPSKIYCSLCVVEHKNPKDKVIQNIIVKKEEENKLITVPNVSLNTSPSSKSTVDQSKRARSDNQTDSYICQICQLGFSSSVKLDAHLHSSHVVVRFSCGSCEEEFKTLETLMDHLRRVHAVEKIDFCSQCGQKFTSSLSVPVTRGKTEPTKVYCDRCMEERQNEDRQVVEVIVERNFEEESSESNFDVSANMISSDSDSDEIHSTSSVDDTGDYYICQICQLGLSTSVNLDGHLRTWHVLKSGKSCFSCGSCQKIFKSLEVLINHLRREHTVQKVHSCGQCKREFPASHTVPTHDTRKVPSQIYCDSCTVEHENAEKTAVAVKEDNDCGQDGDIPDDKPIQRRSESVVKVLELTAQELSSAVDSICDVTDEKDNNVTPSSKKQLKKKERKFTCGTCSKKFWNRVILLEHEQNCSDNRCETCDKKYSSKNALRRHLMTHSGIKPYLCETCGRGFTQKHVLTAHQRGHNGERPFSCDICSRNFADKSLLQQHKSRHMQSQAEMPLFTCNICDRKYKSRSALHEHSGKHKDRKFYCDVCPKVYTDRSNLFNHKFTHTGEKPYACEFCGKRFANGNSLNKHLLTHSEEKPYVCDACGKGFTQKTHLKTHLRVHTGEKPYECDICQRMFSHKYVMIAHRRIHTGERPFQCDVCEKGFVEKSQLTKHKRTHHGD